MRTKKADPTKGAKPVERGRFAKLLRPGFVVEISPSKRPTSEPSPKPKAADPKL